LRQTVSARERKLVGADRRPAIQAMLEARSVAVVGASARSGSFGERMMIELLDGGYEGQVYPVNPKYEEILGLRCYPSIGEVPRQVDVAVLGLPNAMLEAELDAVARAGSRSAVIFASGHEEPRVGVRPLTERLARIAGDARMAMCGGNCMGFLNIERKLRACGFYEPKGLEPGPIAFISHSGSAFSAMVHNRRGLRFNVVVSAGQEFVTTVADYLSYALRLESTRVVGLFIETIRDPRAFRSALGVAAERDVPVVALKVGREARAQEMVAAHSGALAGEDGAYEALFDAYGVLRVESMDEMADTIALFTSERRAGPGGLASIHDSGGERAMMIDVAAAQGVPFARISPATRERLAALLEPGLPPVNPLDAWGTGNESDEIFVGCMGALLEDPDTAALAFAVDLTTEEDPSQGFTDMAVRAFPQTDKPMAVLSNFSSGIDRAEVKRLDAAGIPVLEGTQTGLVAFRHLFAYRDHRARPAVPTTSPIAVGVTERWRARFAAGRAFDEVEGLALLDECGVRAVATRRASSLAHAVAAAEALGYPVAVKTSGEVLHKSEEDGVRLGLEDRPAVEAAYRELAERLGPAVTVARMAPPGVELALGIVRDPQFGPLVLVAAGGLLVEILNDRRLALAPIDEARATTMIDRLKVRPLLDGVRCAPPADVGAVARALVAMSWLAHDLGEQLEALDANPVIAGAHGCVAVDALVIPRATSG